MASAIPIARRMFLVGAASILCESCGDTWVKSIPDVVRTRMLAGADLNVTQAYVDKLPYASIAVRFGGGPQALLILGSYDGDDLHWISASREVIVTRRGRLVKTYGLPEDLKDTQFLTADPVGGPIASLDAAGECSRMIDLEPRHIDGILVQSRFGSHGSDDVRIIDAHVPTDLWTETNDAAGLDWRFTNRFWVDPHSGFVWKSHQYLSPRLPPLEIIVYKPARDNA